MYKISRDGTIDPRSNYPIVEASDLTGISRRTLLNWTKASPPRIHFFFDDKNRRMIDGGDLLRIKSGKPLKKQ